LAIGSRLVVREQHLPVAAEHAAAAVEQRQLARHALAQGPLALLGRRERVLKRCGEQVVVGKRVGQRGASGRCERILFYRRPGRQEGVVHGCGP
jgi:hypothetical protein